MKQTLYVAQLQLMKLRLVRLIACVCIFFPFPIPVTNIISLLSTGASPQLMLSENDPSDGFLKLTRNRFYRSSPFDAKQLLEAFSYNVTDAFLR